MRAELHFLGLVIDLVYIDTEYWKQFSKYQGLPVLYHLGGKLHLKFPYGEEYDRLLEQMATINFALYKLGIPCRQGEDYIFQSGRKYSKNLVF